MSAKRVSDSPDTIALGARQQAADNFNRFEAG
jgi:hypothetical protein